MEKPFELKALVAKLKDKGLDVAEDGAKLLVESTLDWISESVLLSPSKVDDFAAVVIPAVKPFVMSALDKIDGKADLVG